MSHHGDEEQIELQTVVGECLARGFTSEEILQYLQEQYQLSSEGAATILRSVYDSWISVRASLNLQSDDDRNWHQHLRMKLLQKAITNETVPSQNLALRILDSLAGIQGISTAVALPVPLSIELVEKKPEPEPEPGQANELQQ